MIFRVRPPSIGALVLDLELATEHRVSVVVTDNPTEGGRLDGGFKRTLPRSVTIRAAVTAQDMRPGLAIPFVEGTRHYDAWATIKSLWTGLETFDVVTDAEKYKNCTGDGDLVWSQAPGDENILIFSGTFRELQVGDVDILPIPVDPAQRGASKGTNLGKQGTREVT
jgi:hypothetical protein